MMLKVFNEVCRIVGLVVIVLITAFASLMLFGFIYMTIMEKQYEETNTIGSTSTITNWV